MKSSTKLALFVLGAGAGGVIGTYLLLRKNREKFDRAARNTREVADQADRLARTLEGVGRALGPVPEND
jgi:hypothetical protein